MSAGIACVGRVLAVQSIAEPASESLLPQTASGERQVEEGFLAIEGTCRSRELGRHGKPSNKLMMARRNKYGTQAVLL
jgi:hypothetical protein